MGKSNSKPLRGKKIKTKDGEEDGEEKLNEEEENEIQFQTYMKQKQSSLLKVEGKRIKQVSHPLLKPILENKIDDLRKEVSYYKSKYPENEVEWEICMAFWFAVHLKRLEMACHLVENYSKLKKLVYIAIRFKRPEGQASEGDSSQVDHNKEGKFGSPNPY